MLTNLPQWNHCVGINSQTNWLTDTNLSVDCRILRIVEFDLKLLDCSKSLLYEHELQNPLQIAKFQYCKLVKDSTWFKIYWTASTVLETEWKVWENMGLYTPISSLQQQ